MISGESAKDTLHQVRPSVGLQRPRINLVPSGKPMMTSCSSPGPDRNLRRSSGPAPLTITLPSGPVLHPAAKTKANMVLNLNLLMFCPRSFFVSVLPSRLAVPGRSFITNVPEFDNVRFGVEQARPDGLGSGPDHGRRVQPRQETTSGLHWHPLYQRCCLMGWAALLAIVCSDSGIKEEKASTALAEMLKNSRHDCLWAIFLDQMPRIRNRDHLFT